MEHVYSHTEATTPLTSCDKFDMTALQWSARYKIHSQQTQADTYTGDWTVNTVVRKMIHNSHDHLCSNNDV